jgi:hypothetical protein
MQAGTAFAHLLAGRFEEASLWAGKAIWEPLPANQSS